MPPSFIPTEKASYWSITINNPTQTDIQAVTSLSMLKWVKEWKAQKEVGENGTPHIQGMLHTEYIRGSQVKKALPRAHIEIANNPAALKNYVQKKETRVGEIQSYVATIPTDVYEVVTHKFPTYESLETAYTNYKIGLYSKPFDVPDNFALNILDDAVEKVIRNGGVAEFMCSNPSFRTAFKTYFLAIMYRQYNVGLKTEHDIDIE